MIRRTLPLLRRGEEKLPRDLVEKFRLCKDFVLFNRSKRNQHKNERKRYKSSIYLSDYGSQTVVEWHHRKLGFALLFFFASYLWFSSPQTERNSCSKVSIKLVQFWDKEVKVKYYFKMLKSSDSFSIYLKALNISRLSTSLSYPNILKQKKIIPILIYIVRVKTSTNFHS